MGVTTSRAISGGRRKDRNTYIYIFINYNWYVSIWSIKFVSPLTTRISVFSSSPTRRPWCGDSRSCILFLLKYNITEHSTSTHGLICPFTCQADALSGYRARKNLFYCLNIKIFYLDRLKYKKFFFLRSMENYPRTNLLWKTFMKQRNRQVTTPSWYYCNWGLIMIFFIVWRASMDYLIQLSLDIL